MAVVKAWAKDDEFRKNHKFEEPTFSVSPPRIWRMLLFIHVLFFSSSFFFDFEGAWHGSSSRWKSTWRMPKLGENLCEIWITYFYLGKTGKWMEMVKTENTISKL